VLQPRLFVIAESAGWHLREVLLMFWQEKLLGKYMIHRVRGGSRAVNAWPSLEFLAHDNIIAVPATLRTWRCGIKQTQARLLLGLLGSCLWKSPEKNSHCHCLPTLATALSAKFSTPIIHRLTNSQRGAKIFIAAASVHG
jgi:hypothetical protein